MKEFTAEMLQTLKDANDSVRGTVNYTKYWMEQDFKSKGRWIFCQNYIPMKTGVIKTFKGNTYIITEDTTYGYDDRFHVTNAVKELLNI